MTEELRFETRAIHAGQEPEELFGAVNVPIYQNATFAQPAVGEPRVWDYGRGGNPTREAFQVALASLEGGRGCYAFGSGMGAEATLLLTLSPGDHVLIGDDVYGGTYRLMTRVLGPWGLEADAVDLADFHQRFVGRVRAIARTHEGLARSNWEPMKVGDVVAMTLAPFGALLDCSGGGCNLGAFAGTGR